MLDELHKRAEDAIALALEKGARDAWANAMRNRSVEFTYRDGKLEEVQDKTARSLSLDLYVDGRYSSHSTTDLDPDRLSAFVGEAVALTRALQADPDRKIPDPKLFEGRPSVDLQLVDSSVDGITREDRIAQCKAMNDIARDHERVISASSGFSDSHEHGAAVSSNGFSGTWEGTSAWMGSSVTVRDEGDKRPAAWFWTGGAHRTAMQPADETAKQALQRALDRLGSTKGPTMTGLLIIDPRAGSRLLGHLMRSASARSVQQKRSFYTDKLGDKLFSDKLTLIDDPLIVQGHASRLFDSEGIAARKLPIVEQGVVKNLYVDTYYGRKAGLEPTTGSQSNLVVQPGERDLAAIVADVDKAVYVTGWLGGNSDGNTGNFSLGIQGHLVDKGEIGAPIGEMNITGTLTELFANLVEVGSDPWPYARTLAPTLVFDKVSFSGA